MEERNPVKEKFDRGEKPKYIWQNELKHLANFQKFFKSIDAVFNRVRGDRKWHQDKKSRLYQFLINNKTWEIKDYKTAHSLLQAFLKTYQPAYDTLLEVDDFALLEILNYDYGFSLYDVVVSFFDAEYFFRRFFEPLVNLAPKQREILHTTSYYDLVTIRSSTASGKSFSTGRIAGFWWLVTRRNSKLVMTAPTSRQAINILWSEFKQCFYDFKRRYPDFAAEQWRQEPRNVTYYEGVWNLSKEGEQWQALCFSTKDYSPESLQGFHSKFMMVIVDEASGVKENIYSALDRILTGSQVSKYILVGNPTRTSGFFYDSHRADNTVFRKIHISAFDSPNVILDFLEQKSYYRFKNIKKRLNLKEQRYSMLDIVLGYEVKVPSVKQISGLITIKDVIKYVHLYGMDSDKFGIEILGEFPKSSGDYLMTREQIETLIDGSFPKEISLDCQFGIDPATGSSKDGGSATTFAYRNGKSLLAVYKTNVSGDDAQIQEFRKFYEQCQKPEGLDIKSVPIVIDRAGIGFNLYERMKTNGFNVDGFTGQEVPIEYHNQEKYANRRSEAFFTLLEAIKSGIGSFIKHQALFLLSSISYSTDRRGKIVLIPKEKIIIPDRDKHLLDILDAVALAFAPTLKKNSANYRVGEKFFDNIARFWQRPR